MRTHIIMGIELTDRQYLKLCDRAKKLPQWNKLSAEEKKKIIEEVKA